MNLPAIPKQYPALILRVVMGLIFVTHGAARFYYGSISSFGGFLDARGFVVGEVLAWIVTLGELLCGTLLAAGYRVRQCVVFHALVVFSGIWLVHLPNGWFVVGHGSGGVEYSLLILAVLAYLYSSAPVRNPG